MEHLVKRNPDFLLNISTKRKVKAGQSGGLTQSRIGSPPFQLDKNNLPINVKRGDTVWLMESGYGVYAKYKVSRVSSTQKITSLHELDAIRISFDFSFQLQDDFWNNEENKLTKAISKNKALYFTHIATENAEDIEDFPVITKPGLASSWIYLTLDKKKELFSLRGKKTCEEVVVENNLKEYGNIPSSVQYKVAKIWKYKTVTGKSMHETEHDLDHHVPKSIGGPGIFPENIVPLQSGLNRYKSNRIPISFARIAYTYKFNQIDKDALNNWDSTTKSKNDMKFKNQKQRSISITNEVRKWSVEEQRKFYFEILKVEYPGMDFYKMYKTAGIPLP